MKAPAKNGDGADAHRYHWAQEMDICITSVDYAPEDLYEQMPFVAQLLWQVPGPDRPDYWLAKLRTPIR